jgi:adenosyl cobinamide kinase/adenosyl cobinamide phosphate guanylyltransferase
MTIQERIAQRQQQREQTVQAFQQAQQTLTELQQRIIAIDGSLAELNDLLKDDQSPASLESAESQNG